jgi:hypothetical protein
MTLWVMLPAALAAMSGPQPDNQAKNRVALVDADLQALTFLRIFASHPSITSGFA